MWAYTAWIVSMGAPLRVTALDRAGVVNEAKLRQEYPNLATNLRHDLGMWIAEEERKAAIYNAQMGTAIVFVNVALIWMWRRTRRQ